MLKIILGTQTPKTLTHYHSKDFNMLDHELILKHNPKSSSIQLISLKSEFGDSPI